MDADTPEMASVWKIIDRELHRKRLKWADLAKALEVSDQVVNNWSRRGVPTARYADIATFLGFSVEELMGVAPEPKRPAPAAVAASPEPVYTKRANDIAKMFDELKDPDVRRQAYGAIQLTLQMAIKSQRLPEQGITRETDPAQRSPQVDPPPKPAPQKGR